jgi:hypothetical protein
MAALREEHRRARLARAEQREAARVARIEERERVRRERAEARARALASLPLMVVKRTRDGQVTMLQPKPIASEPATPNVATS